MLSRVLNPWRCKSTSASRTLLLKLASQLLLQQLDLTMGWMCSQILLCFRGADRVLALRGMGLCTSVALAVKSTLARRGRVLFVLDEEYCFRDCVLVLSREGELDLCR